MGRDQSGKTSANPHEEVLQNFCKQNLKSKLFKGFYEERRYVDCISGYRDLILLHSSEIEMKSLLEDIRNRLLYFYRGQNSDIWIGITISVNPTGIHIWTELDKLAFGQYWFCVKTLRFRANEIIVKLKMVRPVGNESRDTSRNREFPRKSGFTMPDTNFTGAANESSISDQPDEQSVGVSQFLELFLFWGTSIKESAYDFMSNEISKSNIKSSIKFILLLIISLLTGAAYATKMLGFFTIRFLTELSTFTTAATPIILAIVDMGNKIVGGFYILLAMIWRDTIGNKFKQDPLRRPLPLKYDNTMRQLEYKTNTFTANKEYE